MYFYGPMGKKTKIASSRFWRRIRRLLTAMLILPFLLLLGANLLVIYGSSAHLFDLPEELSWHEAALVLGTSHRVRDGGPNPFFHYRMATAASLYHQGKVGVLLLSGDHSTPWYNEPEQMRIHLKALGVPEDAIILDPAGLRTYDSVLRCKEVYGFDRFVVVSQAFHNQRAVFIARYLGLEAVGLNAPDPDKNTGSSIHTREWFARVILFRDLIGGRRAQGRQQGGNSGL